MVHRLRWVRIRASDISYESSMNEVTAGGVKFHPAQFPNSRLIGDMGPHWEFHLLITESDAIAVALAGISVRVM